MIAIEELRAKIERLLGTAILRNDKNYTDDVIELIEADRRSTARDVCQAIVSKGPTDIDVSDINELADSGEQRAVQDCLLSNSINTLWRQAITEVEKEYE